MAERNEEAVEYPHDRFELQASERRFVGEVSVEVGLSPDGDVRE